jgi:hypothetical protein
MDDHPVPPSQKVEPEDLERKLLDLEEYAQRSFTESVPGDAATYCRKAAEALAKIVLYSVLPYNEANEVLRNPFAQQIDAITRGTNPIIPDYATRAKIRQTLHLLRTYSNPGAHDAPPLTETDAAVAKHALGALIWWAYADFLERDLPALYGKYRRYLPDLQRGTPSSAPVFNTSGADIVRLCYPKQGKPVSHHYSIPKSKILYEYVTVDVAHGVSLAFIFLRKSSALQSSLSHYSKEHAAEAIASLTVCTPRVFDRGREVARLKTLTELIPQVLPSHVADRTKCCYIDDYVWDSCVANMDAFPELLIQDEKYFVDQELFLSPDSDSDKLDDSLQYLRQILKKSETTSPVTVILGRAGVGKTTFAEQAARLVNSADRKIAVYISATDLRDADPETAITTVPDLYKLYLNFTGLDLERTLEPDNFEVNVACGNLVVIIDALDEIESTLKDRFDLKLFLESAVHLNASYQNVTIIVTSRDFHAPRYSSIPGVLVLYLRGFNDRSVDAYFAKRLEPPRIAEAKRTLLNLPLAERASNRHIPLYLSLIGDLIDRDQAQVFPDEPTRAGSSKYFIRSTSVDILVSQIVDRELAKQSLGVSRDDYLDLLSEVAKRPRSVISKGEFDEFVDLLAPPSAPSNTEQGRTSYYISPFLTVNETQGTVSLKYGFLENWLKARILVSSLSGEAPLATLEYLLSGAYDGSAPFLDDATELAVALNLDVIAVSKAALQGFVAKASSDTAGTVAGLQNRRCISGLLYFVFSAVQYTNRDDYAKVLMELYDSKTLAYLSIFGSFYPLDFSECTVTNGWFENYSGLKKSRFPTQGTAFYYCVFRGETDYEGLHASENVFDESCTLSDSLRVVLNSRDRNGAEKYELIKSDLYKTLKVGFQGGGFVWKSAVMYRKVTLSSRITLETFMNLLVDEGVVDRQEAKAKRGFGFCVSARFRHSAKQFIANGIVKSDIRQLINKLVSSVYGGK